jgi:hypothetical protein
MIELSDKEISAYFQRSYTAVDGLWFMKVEDRESFEEALDVDDEVWKILAKIQARTLKSISCLDHGVDALFECLTTKLNLEQYLFSAERFSDGSGFMIVIGECPWNEMMIKSNRQHLAGKIGTRICRTEYTVWAHEFDGNIEFEMNDFLCDGDRNCIMKFRTKPKTPEPV